MTDQMNEQTAKHCVGATLRELREERSLTQEDLASRADLSATYLSGVERGDRNPSWLSIVQILEILDQPINEFGAVYERVKRDMD